VYSLYLILAFKTSAEMKFMNKMAKYTWQDYTTNYVILLEIKINPAIKKIQNCRNNWLKYIQRMDELLHLIMKYQPCGK
jgi:hypothetical protein